LKVFNLPCDQRLRTLSKGQRAKLNLLLGLAFKPDLLILDEPTLGLDPVARRQFVEGVLAEYMEGGRTVFVSSHLINEISGLVDHVGIIHDGSMIRSEPTESLLARVKRVRLVYDGQVPAQFDCTGLLHSRANGREAVLVLDGYEPERARAELARLGAAGVEVEDLNLEEAFIELVGRRGEVEHE
jgi:ABC-2 type transport system ATP-binding protein